MPDFDLYDMSSNSSQSDIDLSVIVPSFQQGPFIRECLNSLIEQDGVNLEVIVFDSCSSDETRKVLREFRGLVDYHIEEDLGQAHAINKGLRICRGRFIGFLNSDDVLLPDSLKKVLEFWALNPSTDLLYGKARYIGSNGEVMEDYRTQDWDWEKFQGECFICQPATFWSRRIMDKIGFLDQTLHCSLDYDYWLRIVQAGGVVSHIDEYLACSRDYPETKTRNLRGRVFVENVKISLSRLGYVHSFWISQYMDYFKYEKRPFWARMVPPQGKVRDRITAALQTVSGVWARDVDFTQSSYRWIV